MTKPTLALLGTGLMGAPMAENLARAGFPLRVWNRSPDKARALAACGATPCDDAAHAVSGADIVISVLTDGAATAALLSDPALRQALTPGALWIEMGSVKPAEARAQAADLAGLDVSHLDAPVSGGTRGAQAGTLAIMAGGPFDAFERARPALTAMGQPVHVGPSGTGQLAKLANQAIVGITIGAVAEAMMMLEQGGADPAAVRAALKGGFADGTILQQHGARMTERDFTPGGRSATQLKDMNNVREEAEVLGLHLPLSEAIRDRYARLCAELDGADTDHSGLYLELRNLNGMDLT